VQVPDINSNSDVSFMRQHHVHSGDDPAGWASPTHELMAPDVGFSTEEFDGPRMAKLIEQYRPWSQPCRSYESEALVALAYRVTFWINATLEHRPWLFVERLDASTDSPPPASRDSLCSLVHARGVLVCCRGCAPLL
jgi:hypothetical protein